jgi:hypothetical protein
MNICPPAGWGLSIRSGIKHLRFGSGHPGWDLIGRSVDALIGRVHVSDVRFENDFQSLTELLALARITEVAHSRPGRSAAMLIEYLKAGGVGGQTLSELVAVVGPAASAVVPQLVLTLQAGGARCYWAARALGRLGPAARGALPALIETLDDSRKAGDGALSSCLAEELKRIDPGWCERGAPPAETVPAEKPWWRFW